MQRAASDTDKHGKPGESRGDNGTIKKAVDKNAPSDGSTRSTFIRMATIGYATHTHTHTHTHNTHDVTRHTPHTHRTT
jgi:hypothetical protein